MKRDHSLLGLFGFLLLCTFISASCGGGGGGGAPAGGSGSVPTGNPSVVAKVSAPAPVAQCPNGGITVETGIDDNRNGLLDPGEVDLTQYVCGGAPALVSIVSVSAGAACPNGGNQVIAGADADGDGILDTGEVTGSDYICNGATGSNGADGTSGTNGTNGTNGANSLVSVTTEPTGTNCPTGGLKVVSWLDTTANGIVDISETAFTNYLCRTPGTVVIQSITATPPVVRPGETTMLVVKATDGAGSPLTYLWSSGSGTFLSATDSFVTTWSSNTVGGYLLQVQVSNGPSTVNGYASILVSAAPSGPIITSVNPGESYPGGEIVISGAGFGASQGTSAVMIGGVAATSIIAWNNSQVRARVPAGAVTGTVTVTVGGSVSTPGAIVIPWSSADNVPIVTEGSNQQGHRIIGDGSGGAIIVWEDLRNDIYYDLYAQRIDRTGAVQWTAGGIAISTASNDQIAAQLIPDGSGGAIIVWQDRHNMQWEIYAQRINNAGQALWAPGGIPVCTLGDAKNPSLAPDGSGGAIIVWEDNRDGSKGIYGDRLNGSGVSQWLTNGVGITQILQFGDEMYPRIAADGSGGAFIVWKDNRGGRDGVYALRIDSTGEKRWTSGGAFVASVFDGQISVSSIVPDGDNGVFIAWSQHNGSSHDVHVQRLDGIGDLQWASSGMAGGPFDQIHPQMIPDGSGGAIITWEDQRAGAALIAYAQRIDRAGIRRWGSGVALSTVPVNMFNPQLVSDGEAGAIVVWQDQRSDWDIYAQRVSASGALLWPGESIAVSTAGSFQVAPQVASDGNGGAIVVWQDVRSGTNYDLYVQGITAEGAR